LLTSLWEGLVLGTRSAQVTNISDTAAHMQVLYSRGRQKSEVMVETLLENKYIAKKENNKL
jgi:hypothetical protein